MEKEYDFAKGERGKFYGLDIKMNIGENNLLFEIKRKVTCKLYEYSQHAVDQVIKRHISVQEVDEAISSCEIIEDYPDDKYGPSCLVLGFTQEGRPLHIQCSYSDRALIKIITVYEPDGEIWIDHKIRRPKYGK
jgi:hypothetical protein